MKKSLFLILGVLCMASCSTNNNPQPDSQQIDLSPSGSISGNDYVDLGLSVKWATYNIGAKSINEVGNYYAWGESKPYDRDLTFLNYNWGNGDFIPCSPNWNIASIYDTATVNWGESWRMPTADEQKELINGCSWKWVNNINGKPIYGYIGTSKKNGKSIFLPASQFISHSSHLQPTETDGVYWSSTALPTGKFGLQAGSSAECLAFTPVGMTNPLEVSIWALGNGATVRAVVGSPNYYFPDPSSTLLLDDAETQRQGITVSGTKGNHTYVDLGLPSRTLWATYNVGANHPTEYGDFFAWGETSPKELYTEDTYAFFTGWSDASESLSQYSKYVWHSDHGKVDGKRYLDEIDDAAYVNWGEEWRIPTVEQIEELEQCCSFWRKDITINGKKVIGCIGESHINGNRIYIPAAGWEYSNQPNSHFWVWYWTNEVSRRSPASGIFWLFDEEEKIITPEDGTRRCHGLPVRAVVKNNLN